MITGRAAVAKEASELITRRKLITSGVAAAAGIGGIYAAASIADKYGFLAPDHQGWHGPSRV
jgi:hypothetical protein